MGNPARIVSRAAALIASTVTVAALLTAIPLAASADTKPAAGGGPVTVSSDSLPTAQLSGGVGWAQAVQGGNVYVGGSFTGALAPGATTGASTRSNLMSYNLASGALNSFAPALNGQVVALAASPDGRTLYLGGAFTTVNGVTRNHLAALNTATGALTSWNPNVNGVVNAVAATASTVFFGGQFTAVGGVTRARAAAVTASSGAVTSFAPSGLDNSVRSMALSADGSKVALGGFFSTIDGSAGAGFGIVDAATGGKLTASPIRHVVTDGSTSSAIYGMSSDGTNVYGNGYFDQGANPMTGNFEGTFAVNWSTGATTWLEDCHGDEFGSAEVNGAVYVAGHPHYCSDMTGGYPQSQNDVTWPTSPLYQRTIAFTANATNTIKPNTLWFPGYADFSGQPAPSVLDWFPTLSAGTFTGAYQAAYNVISSGNYLLETGEFPTVNGSAQYGTARFALPSIAPNRDGPQLSGNAWPIYGTTVTAGAARITWLANYDRDNENLSYTLYRGSTAIYTTTAASRVWYQRPTMTFTDSGAAAGSAASYKVVATDPWGNSKTSGTLSYAPFASSLSSYDQQVVSDGATGFWKLGAGSGSAFPDVAGAIPATAFGGVTRGQPGTIAGDSNTAASFDGGSTSAIASNSWTNPTDTFSVEAWFKTTATKGGQILGAGDYKTKVSTTTTVNGQTTTTVQDSINHDREISTTADGHVTFTVDPGVVDTVSTTSGGYNDGKWHQAVGTLSAAGEILYIDGKQAAANSSVTRGVGATEYWRIGGDSGFSGTGNAVDNYFTGSIDAPATYIGTALTAAQVANHFALATGGSSPNPPTASFTDTVNGLQVSVDGSKSSSPNGSISSYAWDFGDNSATGTGSTATHTYAAAGTYTIRLTVTDSANATGTTTLPVQVGATSSTPKASFTTAATGLAVSFDGTSSTDTGGSITGYAWTFGDGSTGTTATATHTYAGSGTYPVQLTVTDSLGNTNSTSQSVTVSTSTSTTIASDGFTRTIASGLGSADTGGAYTVSGSASNYSVGGGVGNVSTAKGYTRKALLNAVSSNNTDLTATVHLSAVPVGGAAFVDLIGRSIGSDDYRARAIVAAGGGSVSLQVDHGTASLKSVTVSGLTYSSGDTLQIRVQVYGTGPTTVRARVWKVGTTEPTTWQASATDSTAALQAAGGLGFGDYLGSAATTSPLTFSFGSLLAVPTGN